MAGKTMKELLDTVSRENGFKDLSFAMDLATSTEITGYMEEAGRRYVAQSSKPRIEALERTLNNVIVYCDQGIDIDTDELRDILLKKHGI